MSTMSSPDHTRIYQQMILVAMFRMHVTLGSNELIETIGLDVAATLRT